jgi:hypothetical protein
LEHVRPAELLGLTATPERSDGLPLLDWFGNRIAAELRLWDAIDQQRLSSFAYFGIHDGLDLRQVPWRRGRGYDVEGLTNLFTSNDAWARQVVAQMHSRVDDPLRMRALGFCVSVEHADSWLGSRPQSLRARVDSGPGTAPTVLFFIRDSRFANTECHSQPYALRTSSCSLSSLPMGAPGHPWLR